MLRPVRPSLNFWYYLGIISSPSWVFSFLAMDFVEKRTGLVAVLVISTLVISVCNYVLSKLYFRLQRNPKTGRFFGGYERAGKSIGYVLLFFGNIGLYCYSEKSLASVLTFLFLAFYCLSTLFCIQPYTDFGVLEFLLSASMNQAFSLLGIRSYSSWLVIVACIFIGGMRYCLEPVHPPREETSDDVQLPTSVQPPNTSSSSSPFRFLTRRVKNRRAKKKYNSVKEDNVGVQSLQYDLGTIKSATNNFSDDNIIGEGGFGLVYKGLLPDGQEIAVKRLSRTSRQGTQEFKNEMVLVAKLQHRNIVRLLGFCLREEEKILIYEFVPNKSLDGFLFDPQEREKLDWSRRYKIIEGVARGMLYLHEDSRLRIIHRDLKPSNVLLDVDMNAKVSDFGLARIFGNDQTQGNINQIAGTFGYMSPEYLLAGKFSAKSDMFSFGVLVLEIISGKRNNSYHSDDATSLLSYAWKLWREGTPLDLLDPTIEGSSARNEVTRCIHIALLCVQDDPDARPSMATIVLMLNSYSATLSIPQQSRFLGQSGIGSNIVTELQLDQSKSKSI